MIQIIQIQILDFRISREWCQKMILDFRERFFKKDDCCSNIGLDFRISANKWLHTSIDEDQPSWKTGMNPKLWQHSDVDGTFFTLFAAYCLVLVGTFWNIPGEWSIPRVAKFHSEKRRGDWAECDWETHFSFGRWSERKVNRLRMKNILENWISKLAFCC